jgi:malonyl-CoA O-methyltransferase
MTLLPDPLKQQLAHDIEAKLTASATPTLNQRRLADSFGQARDSYVAAARLQQRVALDALAMLAASHQGHLLDLGCGPGWLHPQFKPYCQDFTAVDLSAAMLSKAAESGLAKNYLQADAANLPLKNGSIDTVFSSLMLQWCPQPGQVLSEIQRLLTGTGQLVISTLVQGSLDELRSAFASLDNDNHVNRFLAPEQLMQICQQIPDINWQFEQRCYPLYYPDVISLARELKALGANQVVGKKRTGLTGKQYWQQLSQAYEPYRTDAGVVASYQVLFISGQKAP